MKPHGTDRARAGKAVRRDRKAESRKPNGMGAADKLLYYPNSRVDTGSFQAAESSLRFATA